MKHEDLFAVYQRMLEWIDRRKESDTAEFYKESPESWAHAKEVAFQMYQTLRHRCDDGTPSLYKDCKIDESRKDAFPPYKHEGGTTEFPCVGTFRYRDMEFPVYNDDYGMSYFTVCDGHDLQIDSFGGEMDWYYVLDKYIDKIDN